MDLRSENALAKVMPELAAKVRSAAENLAEQGTFLLVVSGFRGAAQQDDLYCQGRSEAGHIVTNARAGESMHNYGLAVDVVPYLTGESGALNWKPDTAQFQAMVSAMKAQGLEWGGDWKGNLADFDHFQMQGLPASPNAAMKSAYAMSQLPKIWANAAAGKYA